MNMEGLTHEEIAEILKISPQAVKTRLIRRGIRPKQQAGRMNFYDESVVELVRELKPSGRPKKSAEPEPTKPKTKKPAKPKK
jgi:predicted transcriptional regulator